MANGTDKPKAATDVTKTSKGLDPSEGKLGGSPRGTGSAGGSKPKAADQGPFALKTGKARDAALIATAKNQPGYSTGNQQTTAKQPVTKV